MANASQVPASDSTPESGDTPMIEGGEVGGLPEVRFDQGEHREQTASKLAIIFAAVYVGMLIVHYVAFGLLVFYDYEDALDQLSDLINVWLPALTGIVSSVATYYFTRKK